VDAVIRAVAYHISSMNVLRNLSLLLALAAAAMLVSGTLGFTSTAADRGATVEAAGDDSAYVGYDTGTVEAFDGDYVELVTVTNSLQTPLNITDVTLESGDSVVNDNLDLPTDIGTGEAGAIEGTVSCEDDTEATVTMTIEAESTAVWAEIDGDTTKRQFTVECDVEPTVSEVDFKGSGNVKITADKEHVKGTVIYKQNGNLSSTAGEVWLNTTKSVRGQLDVTPNDFDIVAIAFPEDGRTYVHPGWNGNDIDSSESANTAVTISQIVGPDWLEGYDATKES
jgi:hypothetical protein